MPARILVVDDDPTNVEVLTAWLESERSVVSTAADGFEALAKIEAEKPDIVLLDVMLPEMDGFEVCRRIKSDPATEHIPVIMVTARSDVDDLVKGFEAGADDFVTKPFSGLALMARVRAQLRQKQRYESIREQLRVDPLTGAFNRGYFDVHAWRLAARCSAARIDGVGATVSVGAAVSSSDEEEELEVTLERADTALYLAKGAGGNRVVGRGGEEPPPG